MTETSTRRDLASKGAPRRVFIVPHLTRSDAHDVTRRAVAGLEAAGVEVRMLPADAALMELPPVSVVADEAQSVEGCELVMVFGGDGTILRAAELAHTWRVPLLGVNLGHMGFLAESEPEDLPSVLRAVIDRAYTVEERFAIEVLVTEPGGKRTAGWALNDVSLEKSARRRMIELVIAVDDQPLSRWVCDGVVCSTPTGSTAYAWSAGGPVVWPEVEALLVVPLSAHALFSRSLVIGPDSQIDIELMTASPDAVAWCDGRRLIEAPAGSRLEVRRSPDPVQLARLHASPFTKRLVRKFELPVNGWRGSAPETAR